MWALHHLAFSVAKLLLCVASFLLAHRSFSQVLTFQSFRCNCELVMQLFVAFVNFFTACSGIRNADHLSSGPGPVPKQRTRTRTQFSSSRSSKGPVVGARFPAQVALAMVKDPLCLLSQDRPKKCKRIVTGRLFGGKMLCLAAEVLYYVGTVWFSCFFRFRYQFFSVNIADRHSCAE